MKNYLYKLIIAFGFLSTFAFSQNVLNVATGTTTGTYSAMFKDLGKVCSTTSYLSEVGSEGSLDNLDKLLNNQVSLAFTQLDVLKARKQIDGDVRVDEVKALIPLYSEEIHIFTKVNSGIVNFSQLANSSKVVSSGFLGRSKATVVTTHKVGSWGGSVVTAKVLSAMTRVDYQIVVFPTREAAFASLMSVGGVDAVLAVVGQPSTWVKTLTKVALVTFDVADKVAPLYTKARLSYPNININAVPTVAIQSLLVTRNFKTADKKAKLLSYQKCAYSKLTALTDTEGYHPKWTQVPDSLSSFTSWPTYK